MILLALLLVACGPAAEDGDDQPWCGGKCDELGDVPALELGVSEIAAMERSGQKKMYKVTLPPLAAPDDLIVELKVPAGAFSTDFDLYIRKGSLPTLKIQDDWSHHKPGVDESLLVKNAKSEATYFIMVHSYAGSGEFTLTASVESMVVDTDGDGLSDAAERRYGLDPADQQLEGEIAPIPWSSSWFPYFDGGTWAGSMKYDQYVKKTYGDKFEEIFGTPYQSLQAWEEANHGPAKTDSTNESWAGHCHGWSAAAMAEKEPTQFITRNGVVFTVGDQKALLIELHFNDRAESFSVKKPKEFYLAVLSWIGTKRKPIVANIFADGQKWNHPLYKYHLAVTPDAEDPHKRHYLASLSYVSDGVLENFVGHEDIVKPYSFWLKFSNGDIVDQGWEGESANPSNPYRYPDYFWFTKGTEAAPNSPIREAIVREIIEGTGPAKK